MRNRIAVLGLALLAALALRPVPATAQASKLEPGTGVRVTSSAFDLHDAQAVVRAIHGDTLALLVPYYRIKLSRLIPDTARPEIPLEAIDAIDVSMGRTSNFGRGVVRGGLIGATFGLGIGMAMATDDWWEAGDIASAIGSMTILGVVVGGLIGAVSHHDVWQAVHVRPGEAPVTLHLGSGPHGGQTVGVGMTLRF